MITVTKPHFPPLEDYVAYLREIWAAGQLTNHGPMVQRLEKSLGERIDAPRVRYVGNGTLAIQLALRALGIRKQVITTPFSYVATTSSILWEGCTPVFADIDEQTFCLDPKKVEAAVTPDTEAILATHVYGNPCDVEALADIAHRHRLKLIYDGAHAFDVRLQGRSLLSYGDVTTLSFHATKLFHTVEGGALVIADAGVAERVSLLRSFGHIGDEHYVAGINAKASELHAAMGLCMLPRVQALIARRQAICEAYDRVLAPLPLRRLHAPVGCVPNYAYYPVVFRSEAEMRRVRAALEDEGISTRRYFYPSLNRLPYVQGAACPISESIAERVLSLPLYAELELADVERICALVASAR